MKNSGNQPSQPPRKDSHRREAKVNRPYETVLVLPDQHVPLQDHAAERAVLAYAAAERWDHCVLLGDVLDFDVVSSHNEGKPRLVEGQRIKDQFAAGNAYLDRLLAAVRAKNERCAVAYLQGNHEFRLERYLDKHPELEGLLEVRTQLRLAERRIQWVPCWSEGAIHKIGHARFTHGNTTQKYHAAKMASDYGSCIFYGHTHQIQEHHLLLLGKNRTIKAKSCGHLADERKLRYMRGKPTSWQQAVTLLAVFPSGDFRDFTATIMGGMFVAPLTGKVYG